MELLVVFKSTLQTLTSIVLELDYDTEFFQENYEAEYSRVENLIKENFHPKEIIMIREIGILPRYKIRESLVETM